MNSICCCFGKNSNAVDDVQIPLQPSARAPCFVAPVPKLDLSEVADNVSYGTGCHTGTRSFGSEITTTRTSGSSSRYWDTEAIERLETEKICHKIIDDLINALPIRTKQLDRVLSEVTLSSLRPTFSGLEPTFTSTSASNLPSTRTGKSIENPFLSPVGEATKSKSRTKEYKRAQGKIRLFSPFMVADI
ncbi:Oidioi.mRNA.OKI2018_I69.PAR.g13187.t1.cds [Oikopleura dioica]|uniref:Oidioi.mRNA.OKI2018_I69.PAR.g13187.t1.cds n=1 Tax=Oikopleura dioica TaxID=34765 RepID=A0ABN7S835_OIKDI|nr:Oidioi.mRNA.OKI2018_I69.PAR.g13187.t1.cds [Oikopleura dioica]